MDVKSVFVSYILFPLVAFIMGAVMIVLNKKNRLMSSRGLIVTILLTAIALGIPGFLALLGLHYMPWGYLMSQLSYILLGVLAVFLLSKYNPEALESKRGMTILLGAISMLLGIYLYKLVFNWLNDLDYGWLAGTSVIMFMVPVLFWWTYMAMTSIPSEIYTVWYYPRGTTPMDMFDVDIDKLKVLEVELFKAVNDPSPLKVKVKAPPEMSFGVWFKKFIDDYNIKFPRNGINFAEGEEAYGWIFYLKPTFFSRKQFIDPAVTIAQNQVNEKHTIFARRVTRLQHEAGGEDRVVIL